MHQVVGASTAHGRDASLMACDWFTHFFLCRLAGRVEAINRVEKSLLECKRFGDPELLQVSLPRARDRILTNESLVSVRSHACHVSPTHAPSRVCFDAKFAPPGIDLFYCTILNTPVFALNWLCLRAGVLLYMTADARDNLVNNSCWPKRALSVIPLSRKS